MSDIVKKKRALFTNVRICDVAAVFVALFIALLYINSVKYGLLFVDEAFYLSVPHRMLFSDRFLVDEWHVTQLNGVLEYLPFKLIYDIFGGTEGIILVFRYIYIALKIFFFGFLYLNLKRYGWWGLTAAAVFTAFNNFSATAPSYYNTMNIFLCASLILILYKPDNRQDETMGLARKISLFISGILLSMSVLAFPGFAVLYFIYSFVMLIYWMKKRRNILFLSDYSFIIDTKTWFFITLGVLVSLFTVLFLLFINVEPHVLFENMAQLMEDSEYNVSTGTAVFIKWYKIQRFYEASGIVSFSAVVLLCVDIIISLVLFIKSKSADKTIGIKSKIILLTCAVILFFVAWIGELIHCEKDPFYIFLLSSFKPIYISLLAVECYILTEKRDKRSLIFILTSFTASFLEDFLSDLAMGGVLIVASIPAILIIRGLITELSEQIRPISDNADISIKFPKAISVVFIVAVVLYISTETYYMTFVRSLHWLGGREILTEYVDKGPYKGIYLDTKSKTCYDECIKDLDIIKQMPKGRFYVTDQCPWFYLYVDMAHSNYSDYFVERDMIPRMEKWWQLHPDKLPDVIYVPFYNWTEHIGVKDEIKAQGRLDWLDSLFAYDIIKGNAGYILKITGKK